MSKERKAQHMANVIVERAKNRVSYEDAYAQALSYYQKKPFWFGWFSHYGDDYAASVICRKLLGIDLYCPLN